MELATTLDLNNLTIIEVKTSSDLQQIEVLANEIWQEHYTPIIGKDQVEYMLNKFQSSAVMLDQIANGYKYYKIVSSKLIGYLALLPENKDLFISKYYLSNNARGKGYGKIMLQHIKKVAAHHSKNNLRLTVNKYNLNSIAAYTKMGFSKKREVVFDIGNGYIMDDFEMIMQL